jgi:hypothetical protein
MPDLSARQFLVSRLPWVTRLKKTQRCDGYRWHSMSFKALRDPALKEKYRCKNPARWRFRALARGEFRAASGVYCWSHLACQMDHMNEMARTRRKLGELRAAQSKVVAANA